MKVLQANINYSNSYSKLDVNSLKIGATLVFNILIKRDKNYVVIIEAGTILSEKLYEKLKKQDVLYVSKKDGKKQQLTCESLYTYVNYNKDDLKKSLYFLYEINKEVFTDFLDSQENMIDVPCLEEIVKSIILLLNHNPNYLKDTIPHFVNEYEISYHSLHVSIYAICLAHFLNLTDDQLVQIGLAGLMHDTGTKKINDSIKNKDSKLDFKETEAVQKHSNYSIDIARRNNINDPYILDAILHHHECHDGSGYPDRLESKDISDFSSILSICDVFDALTSERPYRKDKSTFDALKIMMKEESMVYKFNQRYLKIFLQSFLK